MTSDWPSITIYKQLTYVKTDIIVIKAATNIYFSCLQLCFSSVDVSISAQWEAVNYSNYSFSYRKQEPCLFILNEPIGSYLDCKIYLIGHQTFSDEEYSVEEISDKSKSLYVYVFTI